MSKRGLTGNERVVLHGLVRYPTLNDRQLSERLDVKVSTVTAIRRRLRRADYFVTRRVPMLHRLGWEIMAAGFARLDAENTTKVASKLRDILRDRIPNFFYLSVSADRLTFLAAEPNYTALRRDLDDFRILLEKGGLLGDGDVGFMVFPLAISILPTFFDYSQVLALAFGVDNGGPVKSAFGKIADVSLTRKETDVLKGLVRYPELNDKALAAKVKVSRQAVSKMRREFDREGLLRTIRIPDVGLLGFDLFMAGFSRFRPAAGLRARADAIEGALKILPIFFMISSDAENVVLGAARNYEQFSALRSSLVSRGQESGVLVDDPVVYVSLTGSTEVLRNCEFGPVVAGLSPPGAAPGR